MAARAWVLNLDADLELASSRERGWAAKRSVLEAMQRFVDPLAAQLLGPEDVLVEIGAPPPARARGLAGRAFCPTPSAIAALLAAGAVPEPSPPREVLRRVNSRAFAASLGQTLPGALFATTMEAAEAHLAEPPPVGRDWRAKRAFGMNGRGQRIVATAALRAADFGFLRACIVEEGVQIEPNVEVEREYAIHGVLDESGATQLGVLVVQHCDDVGAWIATERVAAPDVARPLSAEACRVASALHDAGYFGPFGVDAFTYRSGAGELRLQPRSEINARYTMGFAVGFGKPT